MSLPASPSWRTDQRLREVFEQGREIGRNGPEFRPEQKRRLRTLFRPALEAIASAATAEKTGMPRSRGRSA